jgi:hypothetical protein
MAAESHLEERQATGEDATAKVAKVEKVEKVEKVAKEDVAVKDRSTTVDQGTTPLPCLPTPTLRTRRL